MPEYFKLAIGEDITFEVTSVTEVKTGKYPDYNFLAADGRVIVAPKQAMDRQFQRAGVSVATLPGTFITIERAPNLEDASKSWWNLRIAAPADAKPAPKPKRLTHEEAVGHLPDMDDVPPPDDADNPYTHPTPPAHSQRPATPARKPVQPTKDEAAQVMEQKVAAITEAYRLAWGIAVEVQGEFGTPESVQAGAATILIAMSNRGAY